MPGYRRSMSIPKGLAAFFAKRTVSGTAPQAETGNKPRSHPTGELPKREAAPQQTMSERVTADRPFPASGSGPVPPDVAPPALGASALLDAWQARGSASSEPPDRPKPDGFSFPQGLGPQQPAAPGLGPIMAQPRHLAAFAPWFIAIGGAMGLGGWLLLNTGPSDLPGGERPNAARSGLAGPESAQLVMCPSEPVVPAAGDKDGKFPMQADVTGLAAVDIASFVVLSNEASASGRERDAEVGLLMSCRIADKLKGAASVESADAKYRLGQHYADLSLRENPAAAFHRAEWLARAQILLADSLLTYSTRFGDNDDRSRLAASGLASVRQRLAQKMPPEPATAGSPGRNGAAGAAKLPAPSQPGMAAQTPASPSPAIEARGKTRPIPPAIKECLPAVATLGLCDSPS